MALARPLPPLWQALLPGLTAPARPVLNIPLLQRLSQPFRSIATPFAALALPSLTIPSFPSISDIWEGILKAVPKKKTSYQKKRSRFMAGKGLKDITSLNKCSACGRVKRSHLLCPYCVYNIRTKIFNSFTWEQRNPDGLTRKMRKQKKRADIVDRKYERDGEPLPDKDKLGKQNRW